MIRYSVKVPPVRTPERLAAIVDAATEVFGRAGFARAQMTDIAAAAGVSVGTLYNYVEGKEALLLLCAEHPFGAVVEPRPLPVPVLDRGALIGAVERTLAAEARVPALDAAVTARDEPPDLRAIVGELFDLFSRTRRATDAMERCAREAPDLAEVFYRGVRGRLLAQLAACCARLDDLALPPDVAARFVVETTTWWARHRHHDPEPLAVDEAAARAITITLVERALRA
jgi:AcrR family transcriptional regulator